MSPTRLTLFSGMARRCLDDHDRLLLRLHQLRALLRQRLLHLLHPLARR